MKIVYQNIIHPSDSVDTEFYDSDEDPTFYYPDIIDEEGYDDDDDIR